MFCEKVVPEKFTEFTGKHLYWSLFLIKFQASRLQLYKNETPAVWILQNFKDRFFEEHLRLLLLKMKTTKPKNWKLHSDLRIVIFELFFVN